MKDLLHQLKLVDACSPACEWVEEGEYEDLEAAWAACKNNKWKLWLIGRVLPNQLTGTRIADLFRQIQAEFKITRDYEVQYKSLASGKRRDKALATLIVDCAFSQALYNALLTKHAEWYSGVFDNSLGCVIEMDHPVLAKFVDEFDPVDVSTALEELCEEMEPSAPDQGEISSNITLSYEDVTVRHGFRKATQESGVVAYLRGSEVASATTSEGLYKKLRKSFRGYRIFSVTDHGNVTEFDYSGNEIASWV